jgi:hypothetical protein
MASSGKLLTPWDIAFDLTRNEYQGRVEAPVNPRVTESNISVSRTEKFRFRVFREAALLTRITLEAMFSKL